MFDIYKKIKIRIKFFNENRKYPNCEIRTKLIAYNAKIGNRVALAEYTDIRENVQIGDYSYVNRGTIVFSGIIGKFCSIGYNCSIGPMEHPLNRLSTSPFLYKRSWGCVEDDKWNEINNPPVIGNDVWIGNNIVVLQGVNISDGAVIAAGAVVTNNVPAYAIVGGVPAKVIKYRFSGEKIQELLSSKWYGKPIDKIIKIANEF